MNKYLKRLKENIEIDETGEFDLLDCFTGLHPRHVGSIRKESYYDELPGDRRLNQNTRTLTRRIKAFCPDWNKLAESGKSTWHPKHLVI